MGVRDAWCVLFGVLRYGGRVVVLTDILERDAGVVMLE